MAIHLFITLLLGIMPDAGSGFIFESEGLYQPRMDFSSQIYRTGYSWVSLLEGNPETQPKTGCLLSQWGVPAWAIQAPAAFVGGHIGGWLVSGVALSFHYFPIPFGWVGSVTSWFPWMGLYDAQKLALGSWCYAGLPLGATLGTMWLGNKLSLEGSWGPTIIGALAGDAVSFFMATGYYLLVGDPWAYSPEGAPPTNAQLSSFLYPVLLAGTILPAAGAVIGYNLSIPKTKAIEDTIGYQPSWTQQVFEGSLRRESSCSNEPRVKFTLLRVGL